MNLFTQGLINICIYFQPSKIVQQLQSRKWLLDEIFILDPEVPDMMIILVKILRPLIARMLTYQRARYQPA